MWLRAVPADRRRSRRRRRPRRARPACRRRLRRSHPRAGGLHSAGAVSMAGRNRGHRKKGTRPPGSPTGAPRERLPSAFSAEELRSILAAASTPDPDAKPAVRWPRRDRALVAVLAGSGIRASECVGLACSALTRQPAARLRVHGEGGKSRTVPVPGEVVGAVDDYLDERRDKLSDPGPHELLFVRTNGRALTRQSLYYLVDRWAAGRCPAARPGRRCTRSGTPMRAARRQRSAGQRGAAAAGPRGPQHHPGLPADDRLGAARRRAGRRDPLAIA